MSDEATCRQNELEAKLSEVPDKRRINILTMNQSPKTGDYEVQHSTRIIPPEKALTPRRAHVFASRKAFIAYANLVTSIKSVFLIDPSTGNGELVIDESVPTGGVEKILFQPAFSLQFQAWYKYISSSASLGTGSKAQPITFDQLRDLVAERKSEIVTCKAIDKDNKEVTYDVRALRRMLNQITVSSTVKVHDGSGNGAINGITTETKVKAGTQENEFSLPEELVIDVPVFADEDGGPFSIDVNVVPLGGGAGVKLLCGDLEDIRTAYYADVLADMRELDAGFPCGYGRIGSESHLLIKD